MGWDSFFNAAVDTVKSVAKSAGSFVNTITNGYANGAIGAIAETMVQGAASGVIVGAAYSAITGEDIVKGALQGAAVGGLGGALFESGNQLMSDSPGQTLLDNFTGNDISSKKDLFPGQTRGSGMESTGGLLRTSRQDQGSGMGSTGGLLKSITSRGGQGSGMGDRSLLEGSSGKNLLAALSGGVEGILEYTANKDDIKARKEEITHQYEQQNILDHRRMASHSVGNAPKARAVDWFRGKGVNVSNIQANENIKIVS